MTWTPGKADGLHHVGKGGVEAALHFLPGSQLFALVLIPEPLKSLVYRFALESGLCPLQNWTQVFYIFVPGTASKNADP